jgi:hypothetical protein
MSSGETKVISPIFDVFQPPVVSRDITSYEAIEYQERNVSQISTLSTFNLLFNDVSVWTLPYDSHLQVDFQIMDGDISTAYSSSEEVAISNNGGAFGIFNRAVLYFNDQQIEEVREVGQTVLVDALTSYSKDYCESTGTAHLFYPDAGGINDTTTPTLSAGEAITSNNSGFSSRVARAVNSKQVTVFLPVRTLFRFFRDNPIVMKGNRMKIVLHKETNEKALQAANGETPVLKINKLSWWLPHVQPSEQVNLMLQKQLASGATKKLMWKHLEHIQSPLFTRTNLNPSWRATTTVGKPVRLFILFQRAARWTTLADAASNVSNTMGVFDNYDLQQISARINGITVPREEYEINYESGTAQDYARVYMAYLDASNSVHDPDSGACISFESFREHYPLYVVKVPDESDLYQNRQTYEIEIRAQLRSTPHATYGDYYINCIVESERSAIMKGSAERMQIIL